MQQDILDCEVCKTHFHEVSRLLKDWKEFARAAGLTESEIAAIKGDEDTQSGRRFKALDDWHNKNAYLATNSELIKIMLGIGRGDLAQDFCLLLIREDMKSTGKTLLVTSCMVIQ